MTIQEFAKNAGVKEETIRKRINDIQGVKQSSSGEYIFPEGTRYPSVKRARSTYAKKYYAILKALNDNRYIDETYIDTDRNDFEIILGNLLDKDLIILNGTGNQYGANKYNITMDGILLLQGKYSQVLNHIISVLQLGVSVATVTMAAIR